MCISSSTFLRPQIWVGKVIKHQVNIKVGNSEHNVPTAPRYRAAGSAEFRPVRGGLWLYVQIWFAQLRALTSCRRVARSDWPLHDVYHMCVSLEFSIVNDASLPYLEWLGCPINIPLASCSRCHEVSFLHCLIVSRNTHFWHIMSQGIKMKTTALFVSYLCIPSDR